MDLVLNQHLTKHELNSIIKIFANLTGIKYNKKKLYLLENRLSKLVCPNCEFKTYKEFITKLKQDKTLQNKLINLLTTNFTYFFRESKHFRFLRYILQNKFKDENELRLWSAAASGGHEAYSMAISLLGRHGNPHKNFKILGTDIASEKIDFAKKGIYKEEEISKYLNSETISKFFLYSNGEYKVKEFVKQHVTFSTLNILGAYPFKKEFHVIFLRNILIYFKPEEKEQILIKLSHYLHPQGYLIISLSESLTGLNVPFKHINSGIYMLKHQTHNQ